VAPDRRTFQRITSVGPLRFCRRKRAGGNGPPENARRFTGSVDAPIHVKFCPLPAFRRSHPLKAPADT